MNKQSAIINDEKDVINCELAISKDVKYPINFKEINNKNKEQIQHDFNSCITMLTNYDHKCLDCHLHHFTQCDC